MIATHTRGAKSSNWDAGVALAFYLSLSGENYPKALPLGGTMKAQIRGQVAHQ